MKDVTEPIVVYQPSVQTVEMLCDRLAELGLAVGPDTARELVRAVLAAEAPRVDARLRDALETALHTIRVAAQAGMAVLATTTTAEPARPAVSREPAQAPPPPPAREPRKTPVETKRARPDLDPAERRPVVRRPRGR